MVRVLYGAVGGTLGGRTYMIHRQMPLVDDAAEAGDKFG
jgi:hypothetical protein